jgi:glycosyltransferase involved in cell wall biosynthesis
MLVPSRYTIPRSDSSVHPWREAPPLSRILHVITTLERGGAETMLWKLLSRIDRSRFGSEVVSLTSIGDVGRDIEQLGVSVHALGMHRSWPSPLSFVRLSAAIQRFAPHLVQTWLYHSDLIGGAAARLAGVPVVWNIRSGEIDRASMKMTSILVLSACARLSSHLPSAIVACSDASRRIHTDLGYTPDTMVVIPNGFDLDLFRPDTCARAAIRAELGVPDNAPLVGLIARYDPLKDHTTFIRAAAIVNRRIRDAHFVLVGNGVTWQNEAVTNLLRELELTERFHLLGVRGDIPRITAALDLACSSSISEGFPNTIGEAMACGVPCVVTDVGESAKIVGDCGRVVPSRDANAFANACIDMLSKRDERQSLAKRARERIGRLFSLASCVRRYEDVYDSIIRCRTGVPV